MCLEYRKRKPGKAGKRSLLALCVWNTGKQSRGKPANGFPNYSMHIKREARENKAGESRQTILTRPMSMEARTTKPGKHGKCFSRLLKYRIMHMKREAHENKAGESRQTIITRPMCLDYRKTKPGEVGKWFSQLLHAHEISNPRKESRGKPANGLHAPHASGTQENKAGESRQMLFPATPCT